jgi:dTDP-4-amino-4,6-dideoxygalactose transaminase
VAKRWRIFALYRDALAGLPGVSFMPEAPYSISTHWLTVVRIDPRDFGATREELRLRLERDNIEARPVWKPLHLQPVFSSCPMVGGSVAEEIFADGLCLPSGSQMTEADVLRVAGILRGSS